MFIINLEEILLEEEIWQKLEKNAEKQTEKVVVDDSVWRPNIIYAFTFQDFLNPKIMTSLLDAGFDFVIPYTKMTKDHLIYLLNDVLLSRPHAVSRKPRILLDVNSSELDDDILNTIQKISEQSVVILENNYLYSCVSSIVARSFVGLDLLSIDPKSVNVLISSKLEDIFTIFQNNCNETFAKIEKFNSLSEIVDDEANKIVITHERLNNENMPGKNLLFSIFSHDIEYDNYDGKILGNVSVIGSSVISSFVNRVQIEVFKYSKAESHGLVDFDKFKEFAKEVIGKLYLMK